MSKPSVEIKPDSNNRFRLFEIIAYIDSKNYNIYDVLKNVKGFKRYAFILHESDTYSLEDIKKYKLPEDMVGKLKKPHYHIVIDIDNATTNTALSKKTGVPENYINHILNERSYIRYLIHIDDPDKYQYKFEDIKYSKNYSRFIHKCFDDKETEDQVVENIFCFINQCLSLNYDYINIIQALIPYINQNCYETIYKRYRYEFKDYITLQCSSLIRR